MTPKNEIDTKEEIELEEAKIELEKKKADLWQHRFDTYLAIARDLGLIIVIIATTWFNIMSGNYQKSAAPAPAASLESIGAGAPAGEGFGSGGGVSQAPVLRVMPTEDLALSTEANPGMTPFVKHAGLGILSLLAIIFLVLPRLKNKPKHKKHWLPFVVLFIFLTSGVYASVTVTPTVTETVTPTVTSTVTETTTLSVTSDIPTITPTQAPTKVLYEMVMFKVGKKNGKNIPNVSQKLEKECHSAFMEYDEKYAYVFAIVDSTKNTTWLAISNFLLPLSEEDESKYSALKKIVENEVEYMNGKERPIIDYGNVQ